MGKYKKQADGRYKTTINTGKFNEKGAPIKFYLNARTIKELEEKVAEAKYRLQQGQNLIDSSMLFKDYANKWFEIYKANRAINTRAMYRNILDNHIDLLASKKLKDITKLDIQNQINARADRPRTCEQIKLTVKQILEAAVEDGLLAKNPCKSLELPRKVEKHKRSLTSVELKKIKDAELDAEERAFIDVLIGTGVRPAEMYALTKGDIDFSRREITINKSLAFAGQIPSVVYPKTNSGIRTIQAPDFVFKALKEHMQGMTGLIVFADDSGQYRTLSAYKNIFDRIMKKVSGCKGKYRDSLHHITPYMLRHTFCTSCYYQGVSLKECQRLMGHASYKMVLEVYSHLDAEKENTRDKLNRMYS